MKFLKRLLLLLTICSLWSFKSSAQITPQWKAGTGYILNFYPGKSPAGYDTLGYVGYLRNLFKLKADSVNHDGYVTQDHFNAYASYLGDWNSTFALAGYYNKPGKIVSYNGVMYVIKTNPGTNPPTNTNGGTPYYEPYNPAGKRSIKIMSLAGGVNAYSILSLYEPTTLQAYLKMNIVVGENVSGNFIEAQSIDANLSNIDHLTPLAWYTVNPKTFKSNLDTTLLKNRTVLVQVRYNPGVSGFGTLEVRYKSNYGTGRYTNGIFVKSSTLSNRDLFPLDSTYTVTGTFPVIEPSSTEYLNQIYDANGVKYVKDGDAAIKHYADSLYDRTVNKFNNQTSIAGDKSWTGDHFFTSPSSGSLATLSLQGGGWRVTATNTTNIFGVNSSDGIYAIAPDKNIELLPYKISFNKNGDPGTLSVVGPDVISSNVIAKFQGDKGGIVAYLDDVTIKLDTTGKSLNAKRDFGAVGNSKTLTDVVTTAGSPTITSASAPFLPGDVGKTIGIAYGGTDTLSLNVRKPFKSTIASINSTTSVNLSTNVTATIAGPRNITGVSMTAFSNTVTCSGCTMTQNDKGKQVVIPGVGPINNQNASHSTGTFPIDSNSTCYIYAVTNSTTFSVSKKALFTTSNRTVSVPGAMVVYGNDDTTPLQNAITSALNSKKKLDIPEGKYLTTAAINTTGSNLTVQGYGAGSTIIYPVGTGFSALVANHAASDTISRNVHFRSFEIDGMWLGSNVYDHTMKGILILPATDFSLEYVTIRNCPATGFGSDFMKNYVLIGSKFIHNGRQGFEFTGLIAGAAGVGIGTGKWQDEGGLITGCYADNNFSNNYFWEGQERGQFSGGAKAIGNFSTFSNANGYGNMGTDGMILSNNYSIYDGTGIRSDQSVYQTASFLSFEKNGEYTGNIIRNSFGTPITILTKYGGQQITNNYIENTMAMPSTAGVKLIAVDSTGNNIKEIVFQGNRIKGIKGDGLSIETGNTSETHGSVIVIGNTLVDNGLSNASPGAGIVLKGKTLNLVIRNNPAYDDRLTTSRTQGYGFYVPSAQITGNFFYGENSFFNNITAPDLYTNLTATTYNIGQPLIKNIGPSPLTVTRTGTGANSTIAIGDDANQVFIGKSSVSNVFGVSNTADINGSGTLFVNTSNVRVGIGQNTPTATLHIKAGTASASTAPIKLTSGTNLTAAEAGAIEFDGTDLFYTTSTPTRRTVANLVGTQTFTNKTLTSPQINTPLLNTTSVVGQVWTATNTAGAGTWTALPGPASLIVGTPTIAAGAGAGTSPTVSVTSNGRSLQVTVTTGTLPTGTNAVIATVTLANALSYTPYPVFSSANAATSLLNGASMIYMTSSGASNVTITSGTTALVAATTYVWNITL